MGWTKRQQIAAHTAARAADWSRDQRYTAMRHIGCPLTGPRHRRHPSTKNAHNTQAQYELYMELAEAQARSRCAAVTPPRGRSSWRDAASDTRDRTIRMIRRVHGELSASVPDVFTKDSLDGFVHRMTARDNHEMSGGLQPASLSECDGGQLYRVLEGLKAWGTRELSRRGLKPRSFAPNALELKKHPRVA